MKRETIKFLLTIIIATLVSSLVSVAASGNLFDSNEVTYDNTSSGMSSSNVKGALDELYAAASDYSNISNRVTNLESNWLDNKNIFKIKGTQAPVSTTDRGINIYDDNNVVRTNLAYTPSAETTSLIAYNSTGGWGNFGKLSLRGDSVYINGTNVSDITTGSCNISSTYTGKSDWGSVTYVKLGRLVILNMYEIYPRGFTTQGEYAICTGLPKASGDYKAIISNANGNSTYRVTLSGQTLSWFYSSAGTINASGQLIYISEN